MNFSLPGGPPSLDQAVERSRRGVPSFPIRFWRVATASLPSASDEKSIGAMVWDTDDLIIKWSDGSDWVSPSLSTHVHAASEITNTPAGNIAATNVQAALNELDSEKAASSHTHTLADITDDGTMAAQNASAVAISGGTISDISSLRVTGTAPNIFAKDSSATGTNSRSSLSGIDSASAVQWQVGKPFVGGALDYVNTTGNNHRWFAGGSARMTLDTSVGRLDLASGYVIRINSVQVVQARITGWAAASGTATRTTFATSTVTLSELAERVKALIDDLRTHGLIGT